mmetsp:Transcript_7754/g.13622  ORF Transcript_7754/g.13622 Transcript_7754/m.13622 type:complete len:394 (+) Transcript_7754:151-1332(+)
MEFLDDESAKYPDLAERYQRFGDLFAQKLWHQLTEEVCETVLEPEFSRGRNLIDLYENFLVKCEAKLNQLRFVQMISVIARQYFPSRPVVKQEVEDAIAFVESIADKRGRLGEEAYLVARMAMAELFVQLAEESSLKEARVIMDESQPLLQALEGSGAETVVKSSFFRVACEYYKVAGPADEYYKSCIQFLAYTPQETLEKSVQIRLAIDMSLAALIGETVFNYGEVLSQPIVNVLGGTKHDWLRQLLVVMAAGDIEQFSAICVDNKDAINSEQVLVQNLETLRQKIALLCLMQVIFLRPPEDRSLELKDIARATKLEADQVEWLLMKAMSKGLIKGKIDQIDQVVHVSWLKPRVLDLPQLDTLKDKIKFWSESVDKTLVFVEEETPELFQKH